VYNSASFTVDNQLCHLFLQFLAYHFRQALHDSLVKIVIHLFHFLYNILQLFLGLLIGKRSEHAFEDVFILINPFDANFR
jgi:hypothetical protein